MQRLTAAVAALVGGLVLTSAAVAAVAPGTYKGNLYAGATKIAASPVTIKVAGAKVTITVAKFPIKCQGPTGAFDQPSDPMKYVFKGTLKGNVLSGQYADPLGGTGEYVTARGKFTAATKTFAGTLAFVGRCKGTSAVKAKKV